MTREIASIEASAAIDYLTSVVRNMTDGADICAALVEWTKDAFQYEPEATVDDVIRHLETTDCAATHAPPGLIYNSDLWVKAAAWANDIDAALYEYREATGENYQPRDNLTVGGLVWFAVEWFAHELASRLENHKDEILRAFPRGEG